MRIDLNADVGESADDTIDVALMHAVTSVSIAAGGHAGDTTTIRRTLQRARSLAVAAGVHPSFADREGLGRAAIHADPLEIERLVLDQIVAVASIAAVEGVALHHVKPHGALYNMAARDADLAAAVAAAVATFDSRLLLFGPPNSQLLAVGQSFGLGTVAEGFADRAYAPDGWLISRSLAGSVVTDQAIVVERALRMVVARQVVAIDGTLLPLDVSTICVHSDTADAPALAAAIRAAFEASGIHVHPPGFQ